MDSRSPIQDMKTNEEKKKHWFVKILIESIAVGALTVLAAIALTWFAK